MACDMLTVRAQHSEENLLIVNRLLWADCWVSVSRSFRSCWEQANGLPSCKMLLLPFLIHSVGWPCCIGTCLLTASCLSVCQPFCRTPGETPQARPAGLNVFTTALRCVPYIMPEHWAGSRLMDDLPGLLLSPLLPFC